MSLHSDKTSRRIVGWNSLFVSGWIVIHHHPSHWYVMTIEITKLSTIWVGITGLIIDPLHKIVRLEYWWPEIPTMTWPFKCWGYFHPKHKNPKIFENHLNPVVLVFIGKLSLSTLRKVPICQGFSHFSGFLHHFVLAKVTTSSTRVNDLTTSSQSSYKSKLGKIILYGHFVYEVIVIPTGVLGRDALYRLLPIFLK